MRNNIRLLLLLSLSLFIFSSCGGSTGGEHNSAPQSQTLDMMPLAKGDTANQDLDYSLSEITLPQINTYRESSSFSRVVDEPMQAGEVSEGQVKVSRGFKLEVRGSELASGVMIPTHSASPVIRLSTPTSSNEAPIKDLKLLHQGKWKSEDEAFERIAKPSDLQAYGLDTTDTTFAFRVNQDIEAAPFMLKWEKLNSPAELGATYTLHVLEPSSEHTLQLALEKNRLMSGESLNVSVALKQAAQPLALDTVAGYLIPPGTDQKLPLDLTLHDGMIDTELPTHRLISDRPGLWEVVVSTRRGQGDATILRDAKIAFALAQRTARLTEEVQVSRAEGSAHLSMQFDVQTAVPGRYELSGILYGRNGRAAAKAGVFVSAAAWLEANGQLDLAVSNDLLLEAGISAPFELRNLSLKDQTRMAELWRQQLVLTIP